MYAKIHYLPPKVGAFAPPLPPLNPPHHSITCITLLQLNTEQLGVSATGHDLKVERVWLQGITGCDSVVAIVDNGEV